MMQSGRLRSAGYLALGWLFFALGGLGALLPVLPTTPFMLLALWAFAKSSRRFHDWLYHHRLFGPPLQQWRRHRVIPLPAKFMSVSMMSASLVYLVLVLQPPLYVSMAVAALLLYAAGFILSKPSRAPVSNLAR